VKCGLVWTWLNAPALASIIEKHGKRKGDKARGAQSASRSPGRKGAGMWP